MKIHPSAEALPLMEGADLDELSTDIKAHGLIHPIITLDGAILDGRNRWRACRAAGVEPSFRQWKSSNGMSPTEYVLAANLHRRHLTPSQKAAIAAELLPRFEAEAKERQKAAGKSFGKGHPKDPATDGGSLFKCADCAETFSARVVHCPPPCDHHYPKEDGKCSNCHKSLSRLKQAAAIKASPMDGGTSERKESARVAAKAVGVSHSLVSRAKKIKERAPEVHEEIKAGKVTLAQAERKVFPTVAEEVREHPGSKWDDLISRLHTLLIGLDKLGGIRKARTNWPEGPVREGMRKTLRWMSEQLAKAAEEL